MTTAPVMTPAGFRRLLAAGPLLADGGMGTSLIDGGVAIGACFELLNVEDPRRVEAVHRGFVRAGARVVATNTFGGNHFRLARHAVADRVVELNRAGVTIARRSGAELVAGSMGPIGLPLSPYGRVRPAQAFEAYAEQAAALVAAGADLLLIETQTDLLEIEQAVLAAREAAGECPVVVCATFTTDDRTPLGSTAEEVAVRLVDLGVDALGVNCGEGPAQALRLIQAMAAVAGDVPLVARPNAGGPTQVGGRFVYPATPDYFGAHARAFLSRGVAIVGGCCGTNPAHTAAMAEAVADPHGASPIEVQSPGWSPRGEGAAQPTGLAAKLDEHDFVVAVEVQPPRSVSAAALVAAAESLRQAGADVVDVADSPMARMRMSAWAACRLIQDRAGVETVLHFPTRGRNLLRTQGDLLGAHALGIRNLFVCLGDPVTIGDYPQGSNTADLTTTGLLELITTGLNAGRDRAGSSLGEPTSFFCGAALSPAAADLGRECRLAHRKASAGARFLLTQPVYSLEPIRLVRKTYEAVNGEPLRVPLLVGVLPPHSARHAEFLHNELPGVDIPVEVRERLARAGEGTWREGIAMGAELIRELEEQGEAGVYVVPQFGRYDLAAEVIDAARS